MAAAVNGVRPDGGANARNEGEAAHGFVLDAGAMPLASETRYEGVEREGEEDDGNGD